LTRYLKGLTIVFHNGNGNGNSNNEGRFNDDKKINYWKGRKIVSLNEWKKIANHIEYCGFGSDKLRIDEALQHFPDEYNEWLFAFGVPDGV
jgi:hypothetical protein